MAGRPKSKAHKKNAAKHAAQTAKPKAAKRAKPKAKSATALSWALGPEEFKRRVKTRKPSKAKKARAAHASGPHPKANKRCRKCGVTH